MIYRAPALELEGRERGPTGTLIGHFHPYELWSFETAGVGKAAGAMLPASTITRIASANDLWNAAQSSSVFRFSERWTERIVCGMHKGRHSSYILYEPTDEEAAVVGRADRDISPEPGHPGTNRRVLRFSARIDSSRWSGV